MNRIAFDARTALISVIVLMIILHTIYTALSQQPVFQGIYFASGTILSSNGTEFPANLRLQSHGRQLHQFEEINQESRKYTLKRISSLAGSGRFIIEKNEVTQKYTLPIDRDISFNQTFLSTALSELTLYKLDTTGSSLCFYVKELSAVRCFGPEP
ncbi:hypothetical protein ACYZTX_29325 [Pseudomonas sp. MDT1-17]